MKDFDLIINIGACGFDESDVCNQYDYVLDFVKDLDNCSIEVVEVGEWRD